MKKITPILNRIKQVLNVKTDKEMTEKWGISYSTLDTWKNRDKIPEKRLLDFSLKYGVSFDWLLTGEGEMFHNKQASQPPLNDDELKIICKYIQELTPENRKKVLKYILDILIN